MMNLIARLPEVCALIYRITYFDGKVPAYDSSLDYSANFCKMIGFDDPGFHELMRLYIIIHSDHEGGNASAHTCHLVGSTLSDPYLSLSASMNALAGPLHGLANQEVLGWLLGLQATLKEQGKPVTPESITDFAWATLNAGKVIPGYGHAVLRKTDPRYTSQREFALKHMPDDPLFHVVNTVYEVMPGVLTEHGKNQEPISQCGFAQRCVAHALWLRQVRLLHSALRSRPRLWCASSTLLGSCARLASGTA